MIYYYRTKNHSTGGHKFYGEKQRNGAACKGLLVGPLEAGFPYF
jgi:hypothetical protein